MEIELNGAKLRVFEDGTIERYLFNKWRKLEGTIIINKKTKYTRKRIGINKKTYTTSRIIGYTYLGLDINDKQKYIDHIDNNSLNNNLNNLRIVTHQQNQFNRRIVKGYSFDKKTNKYNARIHINHNKIDLGYYNTEEEAKEAYLIAKTKYHII